MSHDIRTPMNAIVGMTTIAIANMNNSLGGFVRNQLNVAMRYEEEKVLKEKFGKEMEELE